MKTIIIRPSVDDPDDWKIQELENCFSTMVLVDKTICEDRIIYVFKTRGEIK